MNLLITKEIGVCINSFKESCENSSVEQIACECSDTKTASLLFNIFKFANTFDWNNPLTACQLSLQGKSIQLKSVLGKTIKSEKLDVLETASLNYLRHLSTGWKKSSTEESERFKVSSSKIIDTANAVVLQKARPHLTLDSIVLQEVSKIQSDCKVSVSNLSDRNFNSRIIYICGEREQLDQFFEIVRSSLSYEPKSLLHLTLEILSRNYKRDDNDLNILPGGLRDRVNSYLPTSDKVVDKSDFLSDRKNRSRQEDNVQELWKRMSREQDEHVRRIGKLMAN